MAEFDYIVVGAGSAGCVVAARLSEDPDVRVLLLEAGPKDSNPLIHIPGAIQKTISLQAENWSFHTVPQKHMEGRAIFTARGKTLGGSSSINGMVYGRGIPSDFDMWRQQGAVGWSFQDVLPYFRRAETFLPGASDLHGDDGPIRVTRPLVRSPLSHAFLAAAADHGYVFQDDITTLGAEGTGVLEGAYDGGLRYSSAKAYLAPARHRKNLVVATGSQAMRIVIADGRAAALIYRHDGVEHQARARREIVLSGGTFHSPHLLMHSGIGDGAQLKAVGLPVLVDRKAVGCNLQDHVICNIPMSCTQPVSLYKYMKPAGMITAMAQYFLFRKGPMAVNPFEVTAMVRSRPHVADPDLQLFFLPAAYTEGGQKVEQQHAFMLLFNILRPRSRGEVRLASADPLALPLIDPNYLSDPDDREVLRQGFRISRAILNNKAFDPYRGKELEPGEAVVSDADVDAHLRRVGMNGNHPVGTCRMGEDPDAVVDSRLRVRGVDGLRIADASIMPTIASSSINMTVVMIGEKAASMIREDAQMARAA